MSKIVSELQRAALDPDMDIVSLLNKAYLVAFKLDMEDFAAWISSEINGYKEGQPLPDYRLVTGERKAKNPFHGWQPVYYTNGSIQKITMRPRDALPSLKRCAEGDNTPMVPMDSVEDCPSCLFISANQIDSIIASVRHHVLDWALKLEKNGILGEGIEFTLKEKELAADSKLVRDLNINFCGEASGVQIQIATDRSSQSLTDTA